MNWHLPISQSWLGIMVGLLVLLQNGCGNTNPERGGQSGDDVRGQSRDEVRARLQACNDLQMMSLAMMQFQMQFGHLPPVDGSPEAK